MNDSIKNMADVLKSSGINIELTDELMVKATGGAGVQDHHHVLM